MRWLWPRVALLFLVLNPSAEAADALSAEGLVQEVISRSESPHAFDWRSSDLELQLAYGYVDEANNFDNEAFELGVGIPSNAGSLLRLGLRRVQVYPTRSSNQIGRTPYRQAALPTRYEIFGGWDFGLLEGRSMTRLSTLLPDVEHAMFAVVGVHFSHPNDSLMPKRSERPEPLPGQDQVNAQIVLELGLRWQIYLPESFGMTFEALHERPFGNTGNLKSWAYFSGGVLWAFGAH